MFLKKLELLGFKSFADKTEFAFDGGITALVGPNGCGKSNVVDAVRWILGEQSAKSLRGDEMLDVIFNGSGGRTSLGYAEASLTFSNTQKRLPTEFEEVCVTRRLFRSGESEYLMNNQPCRLKDIRELFLDTGVGTDSYWVIEQGKVDALIQANPQERRMVFEEAAGISKYKAKKKEAMARLERVEQDLLRLNDIMAEVQSQLRSIKIQATRARNFQEYKTKLKEMRTALAVHEFRRLKGDLAATTKMAEEKSEQAKSLAAQLNTLDAQIATLNGELGNLDEELGKVMANCATIKGQIESAQTKINANRDRITELDDTERKLLSQIEEVQKKIEELRLHLALSKSDIERLDTELQSTVESVKSKKGEVERTGQECVSLSGEIEAKKAAVIDKLQKIASVQNQLSSSGTEKLQHNSRRSRLETRQREIAASCEKLSQEEQEVRTQKDSLAATIQGLTLRLTEGRAKAANLAREVEDVSREIEQQKHLRARKESRREVLLDLELRAEDVEVGVKTVIEEAAKAEAPFTGVKGMVANLIAANYEHRHAIEASLAEQAQSVVTETTATAAAAVEFLRNHQRGRAAFLALDRVRGGLTPPEALLGEEGVVGRAARFVRYEAPFQALVDHL
ncbi:MAG: hypothetical protein FJ272_17240, partial [Planctomycetes bacterium]|nr:hypothetical protein [Planctomycetota bacterium]